MKSLKVNEIFSSIAGEINAYHQGRPTTFVRLQGCNLRCSFCDSKHTQSSTGGEYKSIDSIVQEVKSFKNWTVCITGGEPLYHENILPLVKRLKKEKFCIVLETNGTLLIKKFSEFCSIVMDYKTEYKDLMKYSNFNNLKGKDCIKFVIGSKQDFDDAVKFLTDIRFQPQFPEIAFSPILDKISPKELFDMMQKEETEFIRNSVLSLQLHKLIGMQ